jgi:hypothetical protein
MSMMTPPRNPPMQSQNDPLVTNENILAQKHGPVENCGFVEPQAEVHVENTPATTHAMLPIEMLAPQAFSTPLQTAPAATNETNCSKPISTATLDRQLKARALLLQLPGINASTPKTASKFRSPFVTQMTPATDNSRVKDKIVNFDVVLSQMQDTQWESFDLEDFDLFDVDAFPTQKDVSSKPAANRSPGLFIVYS